jgi:glyoxalase family protein
MKLLGLHHISLICSDMERTVKFYTEILGLTLVEKTVNLDNSEIRHFYFGDEKGRPGTLVTFFEYPTLPPGYMGAGSVAHFSFGVENERELLEWKEKLEANKIQVTGPKDRKYFKSIYFKDPDGAVVEIATRGPGFKR